MFPRDVFPAYVERASERPARDWSFPELLLIFEGEGLTIDDDEVAKFLATAFYSRKESEFSQSGTNSEHILHELGEGRGIPLLVNWVRFLGWKLGGREPTQLEPPADVLRFQAQRAGAVLKYWMGGYRSPGPM